MKCPNCENETFRTWEGTRKLMGVEVAARGMRCAKCSDVLCSAEDVQRTERDAAAALVARGIRSAKEFRFVRKLAGIQANELAAMVDVRPETVSRWERGDVTIPRPIAFVLGELFAHPKLTKQKLEALAS